MLSVDWSCRLDSENGSYGRVWLHNAMMTFRGECGVGDDKEWMAMIPMGLK
jgi:hypothetical protein